MTDNELIRLAKNEVLTKHKQLYIERFRAVVGYKPACASCSFKKDFDKFKNKIINFQEIKPKTKIMATENKYKIRPKHGSQILSYVNKDKKVVRIYGRNMTDSFAKEYLSNGTKAQIEEREKKFLEIPKETKTKKTVSTKKAKKKIKKSEPSKETQTENKDTSEEKGNK